MDSEQNKTAETAAQENANHSRMVEVPISTIIKGLDKRGISYEVIEVPVTDDNGKPVLDSNGNRVTRQAVHVIDIPEDEQAVMDFMAGKECWFPGCEELREAYEKLNVKIHGTGVDEQKKGGGLDLAALLLVVMLLCWIGDNYLGYRISSKC